MWTANDAPWQAEYLNADAGAAVNSQQAVPAGNGATGNAAESTASASIGGDSAAGSASAASSSTAEASDAAALDPTAPLTELRMPTSEELPDFMRQLVAHHGAHQVAWALLRVVPPDQLREYCDRAWGVRSDDEEEQFARVRAPTHFIAVHACVCCPSERVPSSLRRRASARRRCVPRRRHRARDAPRCLTIGRSKA